MKSEILTLLAFCSLPSWSFAAGFTDRFGESYGRHLSVVEEVISDSEELYKTPPPDEGDFATTKQIVPEYGKSNVSRSKGSHQKIAKFKHRAEYSNDHDDAIGYPDDVLPVAVEFSKKSRQASDVNCGGKKKVKKSGHAVASSRELEMLKIFQSLSDSYHTPFPGGVISVNGSQFHTDFIYSWIRNRNKTDPVYGRVIKDRDVDRIRMHLKLYRFSYSKNITLDWITSVRSKVISILKKDIKSRKVSKKTYKSKELNGLSVAEFIFYFCSLKDIRDLVAFGWRDEFTLKYLLSQKKSGIIIKKPEFKNDVSNKSYFLFQYKSELKPGVSGLVIKQDEMTGTQTYFVNGNQNNPHGKKYLPSFLSLLSSDPDIAYNMFIHQIVLPDTLAKSKVPVKSCLGF